MQHKPSHLWTCYQALLAFACWGACCIVTTNAYASIEQPVILAGGDLAGDFEQLLNELETQEASSSAASNSPHGVADIEHQESPPGQDLIEFFAAALSTLDGPSSGTSTTSSNGGGVNGSGSVPIHVLSSTTTPDLALVGWTQGEARFTLPEPPGNDLLRPPQVAL